MGQMLELGEEGAAKWRKTQEKLAGKLSLVNVVEQTGEVAGFLHAGISLLPDYYREDRAGVVFHLYVLPRYRGQGVAGMLAGDALNWFAERKADTIELQVLERNEKARKFWSKLGFVDELRQMRKTTP